MLNGVVSYFLTLQSINTEGKNKQAMSQTKGSSVYKASLVSTAGVPRVPWYHGHPRRHFSERPPRDGTPPGLIPCTLTPQ